MDDNLFGNAAMMATIIRVRDVGASVKWYRDNLGLTPIHLGSDGPEHPIAAYAIGNSIFTLWQLPAGGERVPADNDRNSYVVMVMDSDLEPVRQRLAGQGVEVGALRRSVNNEFFWFYDPDYNRFEVSRPITAEFEAAAKRAIRQAQEGQ
jgi:catechol 2,3-dioxygenase-like lactoylglutathione lyase family enzyme